MSYRFDLSGRRAIVTGAARGLGLQMGIGLAEAGAEVWALDVLDDQFDEASQTVDEAGLSIVFRSCDVTKTSDVAAVAAAANDGKDLILVNNAGIGERSPMMDLPREEWNRVLDVNAYGMFLCARDFGSIMLQKGHGSIVNIASVYGFLGADSRLYVMGDENPMSSAYATSKGGVIALTRSLAVAWANRGVRVNSISPGMFLTEKTTDIADEEGKKRILERTPMARFGRPEDLIGAVVYLASDASSFVTGHNLVVDGGWSVW